MFTLTIPSPNTLVTPYLEGRDVWVAGSAGVHYLYETQERWGRGQGLLLELSVACLGAKAEQKNPDILLKWRFCQACKLQFTLYQSECCCQTELTEVKVDVQHSPDLQADFHSCHTHRKMVQKLFICIFFVHTNPDRLLLTSAGD